MIESIASLLESSQRIEKVYRRYFQLKLADYGFTPNEIVVILFLYNNAPEFDTATDIAKRKRISKGLIARSVESLCEKNYLEAVRDTKDRRIMHLRLKDEHNQMAAKLEKIQMEFFSEVERDIPEQNLSITHDTISRLLTNANSILDRRERYAE